MKSARLFLKSPQEQLKYYIKECQSQIEKITEIEKPEELLLKISQIQSQLVKSQILLLDLFEEIEAKIVKSVETDVLPYYKTLPGGGIKLRVPLYPPKTHIINRLEFNKKGKFSTETYQMARNKWLNIIQKVQKKYNGPQIDPCFILIRIYAAFKNQDIDNYTIKFIIDALKDSGLINKNDSIIHVKGYGVELLYHKDLACTDIFILPCHLSFFEENGLLSVDKNTPDNQLTINA